MKRRSFMKKSALAADSAITGSTLKTSLSSSNGKDIYESKVNQLAGGEGKIQLKKYYSKAVIPFLNKRGAKAGFFMNTALKNLQWSIF